MDDTKVRDMLQKLHVATLTAALKKIQNDECSASDLKVCWDILKDNNVPLENMRKGLGVEELTGPPGDEFLEDLPPNLKIA